MTRQQRIREADKKVPMDFANASKQPWECSSYAEFLASLPEEEMEAIEDARLTREE